MEKSVITQEELENVAKIYDRIRSLYRKKLPDQDVMIAEAFENHIKSLMGDYTSKTQANLPYHELEGFALSTKFHMYKLCIEKAVGLTKAHDTKLGSIMNHIYKELCALFDILAENYFTICSSVKDKNDELIKAKTEVADVLEAAEALEKDLMSVKGERDQYKDLIDSGISLDPEIQSLQAENRRYLDKIIQLSKN
jgi:hypothetical protein